MIPQKLKKGLRNEKWNGMENKYLRMKGMTKMRKEIDR